ncbi:MAG: hypothetical protein AAB682_00695, partial [Patescibacteria group bacterium]
MKILLAAVLDLVSLEELASLLAAPDKCRRIAESVRDVIRNTAVTVAEKLGVITEVTGIPLPAGARLF